MRLTVLGLVIAGLAALGGERSLPSHEAATIVGVVRAAGTQQPIPDAAVFVGHAVDSARTGTCSRTARRTGSNGFRA